MIEVQSRLPNVGTTIFTVISSLAHKHGAVNLGQGFPDFNCHEDLINATSKAMQDGHNQYAPMHGIRLLREEISKKIKKLYNHSYNIDGEITITAGATQAITTALMAVLQPDDEAIVLEPCYDSYVPAIEMAGAKVVHVALNKETFAPDFDAISDAITKKTKAIIINTPHNPTATLWSDADMQKLQEILEPTNIVLISDEVYEHMTYDGNLHFSVCKYPKLANRAFVISSFGKTYHITGWKIGYVVAPKYLMDEFCKVHQFNVFCVHTPSQYAIAKIMQNESHYENLSSFYAKKRDFFRDGLKNLKFKLLPSNGTYFQCVDYSDISQMPDMDFCEWLISEIGVAAIPVSAFYGDKFDQKIVRFCYAKKEKTLISALEKLKQI